MTTTTSRSIKPALESLETRAVPATLLSGGNLYIYGTNGNDVARVVQPEGGNITVTDNGVSRSYTPTQLTGRIHFYGYAGHDQFRNYSSRAVTAYAGAGDDTLLGGNGNDLLYGEAGLDSIYGFKGNDIIHGGNDTVSNYLYGGEQNDVIVGGNGLDAIYGEAGNDTLWGMGGGDYIFGDWDPTDFAPQYGVAGNDGIDGGDGNDRIDGGAGNDNLWGRYGRDSLWGGSGDDLMDGGVDGEVDYLHGGAGRDTFVRDWITVVGIRLANRDRPADFVTGVDMYRPY